MAKTTAPLLSFDGRGSIAKTMVYSSWKGIPYVRRHVIPANPRSTNQVIIRSTFALLREMYKLGPTNLRAAWDAFAQGRPFTGMNKFVGENVRLLKYKADMADFLGSPGAKGGLPPATFATATGAAAGQITVSMTAPAAPPGWTVESYELIYFRDQAPDGIFTGVIGTLSDPAPYAAEVIGGLDAGEDYVVAGWIVWTKPNEQLAYSVSLAEIVAADA